MSYYLSMGILLVSCLWQSYITVLSMSYWCLSHDRKYHEPHCNGERQALLCRWPRFNLWLRVDMLGGVSVSNSLTIPWCKIGTSPTWDNRIVHQPCLGCRFASYLITMKWWLSSSLGEFSARVVACKPPLITNITLKSGIVSASNFNLNFNRKLWCCGSVKSISWGQTYFRLAENSSLDGVYR